jgi:dihydrolipoamide dehydrogenase
MAETFDILIIGAGPGGYVAAIRAAQLGFKTAIVEEKHLGGICLNWGCIPTKALLRSAEVYRSMQHAEAYGLSCGKPGFEPAAVVRRSREIAKRLNNGVAFLLKKNAVKVYDGRARLTGPGKVAVAKDGKVIAELQATHVILATGARPRVVPGLEPDGKLIWTYFEAMVPEAMPRSLLVVGSGAIGIEFASFYRTLGAEVTVVEILPQILPAEDEEIAALARKELEKQGIRILTGAKVTGIRKGPAGVGAAIEGPDGAKSEVTADRVISAVGVVGNVEELGLEALGVPAEAGRVAVDGHGRTSVAGIYAVGDVAGAPMLAHKAEHEGVLCVEKIKGLDVHPLDKAKVPGCTYCHPQVASVGLTERHARERGHELRIGRFPFRGNGKAIALGEDQGLVKTVFDRKSGELLGAHMVGAEVTELIQGFAVAMNLETTESELMATVFPHPTLSEMMHEAVLDAYGRVIHM